VGGTRKVSREDKKEEERLHRLLVPIWIAFRRRMFPLEDALEEWIKEDDERDRERIAEAEAEKEGKANENPSKVPTIATPSTTAYPELGFKTKSTSAPSSSRETSQPSDSGAEAASKMFLGMAVTGFIMSDKRVRKYVQKEMKK